MIKILNELLSKMNSEERNKKKKGIKVYSE